MSSPRPWGCFSHLGDGEAEIAVFPTPVGVFPDAQTVERLRQSLPHARGGVSPHHPADGEEPSSSPRPWGCFRGKAGQDNRRDVFPTPVGVFRKRDPRAGRRSSLPHARGGVSVSVHAEPFIAKSSPRPWGCFYVFSLLLVSIPGLPHARGGVSVFPGDYNSLDPSSPRPWGCFWAGCMRRSAASVFPTPVGVFLYGCQIAQDFLRLPHARGGVSTVCSPSRLASSSSPRPWGCFLRHGGRHGVRAVFPTPVGVFPALSAAPGPDARLPHARGGVSCGCRSLRWR